MAASFLRKRSAPADDGEWDIDTKILITELLLEDIDTFNPVQIRTQASSSDSGSPMGHLSSLAGRVKDVLQRTGTLRLSSGSSSKRSRGEQSAIIPDAQELLRQFSLLTEAEFDDRRAAEALARGEDLPEPTEAQKAMQRPGVLSLVNDKEVNGNTKSPENRTGPLTRSAAKALRECCIVCGEICNTSTSLSAPCSHRFCPQCVTDMVEAACRDEQLFPLQCCQQLLPVDPLLKMLPKARRKTFKEKIIEVAIPPPQRIYCPKARCSAFLGEVKENEKKTDRTCTKCNTLVCLKCKNQAHPGDDCKQNLLALETRALAAEKGWQTCPGCKMIVERVTGCLHMFCRCRTSFCYRCGKTGCSQH
ncbi:hypothetical protein EDC04DRAFT_1594277 [Pisolithus marmoratus]|nr:hypothetical protein EDC04DRAFT_1594277 [Pisolithus marmoratus]